MTTASSTRVAERESGRYGTLRSGGDIARSRSVRSVALLALVRGLEAGADERHEVLQLRVVAILELALHLVHGMNDGGVVAAAEARSDQRQRGLGEVAGGYMAMCLA